MVYDATGDGQLLVTGGECGEGGLGCNTVSGVGGDPDSGAVVQLTLLQLSGVGCVDHA